MQTQTPNPWLSKKTVKLFALYILIFAAAFIGTLILFFVANSPVGSTISGAISWILATNSQQVFWYITRAAGLVAYLLLWLSTAWGLAVSSKILDGILHRTFTYDFHQFISLLALGFLALHLGSLTLDHYLPFNLLQILVPVFSPYRPVWVAIGGIGLYLSVLVTVTYYIRGRIGMKAFRSIHVLSLVGYLGATIHSFFSGTDTSLLAARLLYFGSFLVVVFLLVYWVITRPEKKTKASPGSPAQPVAGGSSSRPANALAPETAQKSGD